MDDMAAFAEQCFQRERRGYPPVDLEAVRAGRPQPLPPDLEAEDRWTTSATQGPSSSARHGNGRSTVFTVRLAREDLALLEERAHRVGTTPSALARNLINLGLRDARGDVFAEAVRRVEDAAAALRAALP